MIRNIQFLNQIVYDHVDVTNRQCIIKYNYSNDEDERSVDPSIKHKACRCDVDVLPPPLLSGTHEVQLP